MKIRVSVDDIMELTSDFRGRICVLKSVRKSYKNNLLVINFRTAVYFSRTSTNLTGLMHLLSEFLGQVFQSHRLCVCQYILRYIPYTFLFIMILSGSILLNSFRISSGSTVPFPVKKYSSLTGKCCSFVVAIFCKISQEPPKQTLQEGLLSE